MKQDTDGEPRPLLRKNENVGSVVIEEFSSLCDGTMDGAGRCAFGISKMDIRS